MKTEETINYNGIELSVSGNYIEEEREIRYFLDGSGHPGFPSSFEAIEVKVIDSDVNIIELFSLPQIEEIEELVIEEIEK